MRMKKNSSDKESAISAFSLEKQFEKVGLLGIGGAAVVYLVKNRMNEEKHSLYALKMERIAAQVSSSYCQKMRFSATKMTFLSYAQQLPVVTT